MVLEHKRSNMLGKLFVVATAVGALLAASSTSAAQNPNASNPAVRSATSHYAANSSCAAYTQPLLNAACNARANGNSETNGKGDGDGEGYGGGHGNCKGQGHGHGNGNGGGSDCPVSP